MRHKRKREKELNKINNTTNAYITEPEHKPVTVINSTPPFKIADMEQLKVSLIAFNLLKDGEDYITTIKHEE